MVRKAEGLLVAPLPRQRSSSFTSPPRQQGPALRARVRFFLAAVVLLGVVGSGVENGWAQELPATPAPVSANDAAPMPRALPLPPPPPPLSPPPFAPAVFPGAFEDSNGPLLHGDPLLNPPDWQPGWFASFEVGILDPHIVSHLVNSVVVTPTFTDTVLLPVAQLEWTASPRIELGYRFDQGFGEVRLAYQSLVSEGTSTIANFDVLGDGGLKSRLNVNLVDLDYAAERFGPGGPWGLPCELQFRVGARLAGVFFDSRAQGIFMEQRVSNQFFGAGPHAGLDVRQPLSGTKELSLFGRIQGAVAIGRTHQSFEETFDFLDGTFLGGATNAHANEQVPMLDVQAGLTWAPCWSKHQLHVTTGYQFQEWWYVGQGQNSASDARLSAQGLFVRAEVRF